MIPGTQVIYMPLHIQHRSVGLRPGAVLPQGIEAGFTSHKPHNEAVFVRYWLIDKNGKVEHKLRTMANSELTNVRDLIVLDMVPQKLVDSEMVRLGYVEEK